MFDFVTIKTVYGKRGSLDVYPEFLVGRSRDLMIRGSDFYAVWDESTNFWTTDPSIVSDRIDDEIRKVGAEVKTDDKVNLKLLRNFSSRKWKEWQAYCQSMPDNYHELDDKIIFSNTKVKKTDYVSKALPYALEEGDTKRVNI